MENKVQSVRWRETELTNVFSLLPSSVRIRTFKCMQQKQMKLHSLTLYNSETDM